MSVRQLEFQLTVIRYRLFGAALDVEQAYFPLIENQMKAQRHKPPFTVEHVREAVMTLRSDQRYQDEFVRDMRKRQPDLLDVVARGVTAATYLFHHHEKANGQPLGQFLRISSFWHDLFRHLAREVYIHPLMYVSGGNALPLHASVEIIEQLLDRMLYAYVPIQLTAVPAADVAPLTPANIARRGRQVDYHPRPTAPSALSLASSVADGRDGPSLDDQADAASLLSEVRYSTTRKVGSRATVSAADPSRLHINLSKV